MATASAPGLLALHGAGVLRRASSGEVASRYGLPRDVVEEHLLDAEALGWVRRSELAAELDAAGARQVATTAHAGFLPLDRRFGPVCSRWQIRPRPGDPLAADDHTGWGWDEAVLRSLAALGTRLQRALAPPVEVLPRFDGHGDRYRAALRRVDRGERSWVDAPDRASCHLVRIQVHEDLLATPGVERGSDDGAAV